MARREPFQKFKRSLERMLVEERDIGYLDPGIEPLLDVINSLPQIATTSTCTGRIALVEAARPWERGEENYRVVFKTHTGITLERLLQVISQGYCNLWMKVSPPIIHARVATLDCARHLLYIARTAGFKHSGIISPGGESGIVVEFMSGAQLTIPLVISCQRVYSASVQALQSIVDKANETLRENRLRLENLASLLSRQPGPCAEGDHNTL
jgi:tRNA wybutosine-synthesizing protein 3